MVRTEVADATVGRPPQFREMWREVEDRDAAHRRRHHTRVVPHRRGRQVARGGSGWASWGSSRATSWWNRITPSHGRDLSWKIQPFGQPQW